MVKKTISRRAFTITEVMIAIVIFIIAFLGTSAYRYHAALSAHRADLQTTAARTALLLCEGWSGVKGVATFDPVAAFSSDLTISENVGPEVPDDFTLLDSYKIVLEGTDYYATLSWQDLATGLRALNVIVSWDQTGQGTDSFSDTNKSYRLTTYVENPG